MHGNSSLQRRILPSKNKTYFRLINIFFLQCCLYPSHKETASGFAVFDLA